MSLDVYTGWDDDTAQPVIFVENLTDFDGGSISQLELSAEVARELRLKIGEAL